jgi:hypothetical protein
VGLFSGGPLKAEAVAVGIVEPELLHAVRCDLWLVQVQAVGAQVLVSGVEIFAPEEEAGIAVSSDVSGIRSRRALVGLISGY